MDPEMLKLMTDPEARKDPARMRAMVDRLGKSARSSVIDSARSISVVMSVFGYVMMAAGFGLGVLFVLGVAVPDLALLPTEALFAVPLLAVMGGAFAFFGWWTAMPSKRLLENGSPARATV